MAIHPIIARSGAAFGASLIAAGCASTAPSPRGLSDAAAFTGSDRLYTEDQLAAAEPPVQYADNGAPMPVVSYVGIDGARMAHLRFAGADAEQLDGRCERFVAAAADESLIDIAQFCDVPVSQLVDYNPDIGNLYYLAPGQIIEVPGGAIADRGNAFAMAAPLTDLYTVRPGDSLGQIAYRFNVSGVSIAALNPEVSWAALEPGQQLRIPVVSSGRPPYYVPSEVEWVGYDGTGVGAADPRITLGGGTYVNALKPYRLRPVDQVALPRMRAREGLDVDRDFVRAGQYVTVTASAPPGTAVTIYRGDNVQNMQPVDSVVADESGRIEKSVRIGKKTSDMGGVVFKGVRDDTGETVFSERVGVNRLGEHPPAESEDQDEDEGLAEE